MTSAFAYLQRKNVEASMLRKENKEQVESLLRRSSLISDICQASKYARIPNEKKRGRPPMHRVADRGVQVNRRSTKPRATRKPPENISEKDLCDSSRFCTDGPFYFPASHELDIRASLHDAHELFEEEFYSEQLRDTLALFTAAKRTRSTVSIRTLHWLLINYSAEIPIKVRFRGGGEELDLHELYNSFGNTRMSGCRRMQPRLYFCHKGAVHQTTPGQLRFFCMCIAYGIIPLAETLQPDIQMHCKRLKSGAKVGVAADAPVTGGAPQTDASANE